MSFENEMVKVQREIRQMIHKLQKKEVISMEQHEFLSLLVMLDKKIEEAFQTII